MIIQSLTRSPILSKRWRVVMTDGTHYDFSLDKSETYLDHKDKQLRENYRARHLSNPSEHKLIHNLVPSPALFAYYITWGDSTNIIDNIKYLNKLLKEKYGA